MYALVEFEESDGGGLAVVFEKWLTPRKREVFWPPVKEQNKFDRILRLKEQAEPNWKLYKVCRCLYETDDFDKAQKKLKVAHVTSDLGSEREEEDLSRKRKRYKRVISSDDDDSVDVETAKTKTSHITLQGEGIPKCRPPQIQKSFLQPETSTFASDNFLSESGNSLALGFLANKSRSSELGSGASTSNNPEGSYSSSYIETPKFAKEIPAYEALLQQILFVKEQNNKILSYLENNINLKTKSKNLSALPIKLPLQTAEDLEKLEDILKNEDSRNELIQQCATEGGRDITTTTTRVLRTLLTNKLASGYSFRGKKFDKKPFCNLYLLRVVIGSVQIHYNTATNKDIEDIIKVWLKHAPERFKSDQKKAELILINTL